MKKIEVQINLDLRNCNLRKDLDLRKIVGTTKILVHNSRTATGMDGTLPH